MKNSAIATTVLVTGHMSNEKARRVLGWEPRAKEITILETIDAL